MGSQQLPRTDNHEYLGITINYNQHEITVAATYQQSAEQSQQDTCLTQNNSTCDATASDTNGIRGTRATNAQAFQLRLGTSTPRQTSK